MLISQGPLRVSLFGGGSDLPAFLESNEGAVLSFAIDRRVFIVGHPFTHRAGIVLKYSQSEDVESATELKHPIAREVLSRYGVTDIDIAIMSDVPAGTGLGSSSSFTVAFLAFVRNLCGLISTPEDLAREACDIEIVGMATLALASWARDHLADFDQIICECYNPRQGPNSGWVHISLKAPGQGPNRRQCLSYVPDTSGRLVYVSGLQATA